MANTEVKLLILCGNLILSDAALTYTHICSECVKCKDNDSYCKSCISNIGKEKATDMESRFNNFFTSVTHGCSLCFDDEGSGSTGDCTDDYNVVCQKCTACDSIYVCFKRFFSPQTSGCTDMSKKDVSSILPDDKLIVSQVLSTVSTLLFTEEKSSRNTPTSSESKDSSILIKNYNTDSPLAYVGSALGGVVFGSIVTSFVCVYLRRRSHTHRTRIRKQETGIHQSRNYTQHCLSKPLGQGHGNSSNEMYCEIEDKKGNSKDLFHETPTEKSQTVHDTNDGVYSHWNETNQDAADRSEYYDHVTPLEGSSVNVPTPSHGYGTVTVINDGNVKRSEDGESIDDNDKSSENAAADEYFVLEKVQ